MEVYSDDEFRNPSSSFRSFIEGVEIDLVCQTSLYWLVTPFSKVGSLVVCKLHFIS